MFLFPFQSDPAESIWIEAESFAPLRGANFSYFEESRQSKGSWSLSGPGVAAEWTQGGESEFMSIAARADEGNGTTVSKECEIPHTGTYRLWVRYADYRNRREEFTVNVVQTPKSHPFMFGSMPNVDDSSTASLYWGWAFVWDSIEVQLTKGTARIELITSAPSEARRQIDCLCITTDTHYTPSGREKPDRAIWKLMRTFDSEQLKLGMPSEIKVEKFPAPRFYWNAGKDWLEQLEKPDPNSVRSPFAMDKVVLPEFLAAFKGKQPPVVSSSLSSPTIHIPLYPQCLAKNSSFMNWSGGKSPFAILLNYGEPVWLPNQDKSQAYETLKAFGDEFAGYISGENIGYADPDPAKLAHAISTAKTREEILVILEQQNTERVREKFKNYYGKDISSKEAWSKLISCLSVNMESYAHMLARLGEQRVGHENTGNGPTLARRLAFLRGAARQFGTKFFDYQSCNLGDSATMFSTDWYFYPASPRFIFDNQYDAWAGAGVNWLLKDYVLWWAAGVDGFYNEQGVDLFWKPGGNSAGTNFPLELSPKGKVAEKVINLFERAERGDQYAPIAFLLDEAHGYAQERFQPGRFGIDPMLNQELLTPGRHDANIRAWLDAAYFPAPQTQNEPASGIVQTYVNGIFGDIFDVIVDSPRTTRILSKYRAVVLCGELSLNNEWLTALKKFAAEGGTIVICEGQLSDTASRSLGLSVATATGESNTVSAGAFGELPCERFQFQRHASEAALARSPDGTPLLFSVSHGKGRFLRCAIPYGLGIGNAPNPVIAIAMREIVNASTPMRVDGDVEWALCCLASGKWQVTIFNNSGEIKPQHGVNPTNERERRNVQIRWSQNFANWRELMTNASGAIEPTQRAMQVTLPAGSVRIVQFEPGQR